MKKEENIYIKQAVRIVQQAGKDLYRSFRVNNDELSLKDAILQFTLVFYPDYKIKFIENKGDTIFTSDDIWFNGDIEIGIGTDVEWSEIKPSSLINRIAFRLENRKQLKNKIIGKYMPEPYNIQIGRWAKEEFANNVIEAVAELEEYGNTRLGSIYKYMLHDGEVKESFFKEIGKMYKKKIYAEL